MTPRDLSLNRRKAVLIAHKNKCAITGIDDLPIQVDHIIPLFQDGSNDFNNLVPVLERINKKKNKYRYPIQLEQWLLFVAAGKVAECERVYARLSHKTNPLPSDPSKIDLTRVKEILVDSKNWTVRQTLTLIRCWVKYGMRRFESLARRLGKTVASLRVKLVWLGIYRKDYAGLIA